MRIADKAHGPHRAAPGDVYKELADVFHLVLSEDRLPVLLDDLAAALTRLMPYDALTVYQADEARRVLDPVLSRDEWAAEVMAAPLTYGAGVTGRVAETREAVLVTRSDIDPRVVNIPGTPLEPEAFACIPLVAKGSLKGVLNVYRLGDAARFTLAEYEVVRRFGEAVALALDHAEIRASLERHAQSDSLTGVYSHRYFHERLRSELTKAGRARDSVAVLMVDIDDFKRVNDVFGHSTGDDVLVQLAKVITMAVRTSDAVCRLGGEEFAVIMPSCRVDDALGLAERINERLASDDLDPVGKITVSLGIAEGPAHATNARELTACAEAALLEAKEKGKNGVVVFHDQEAGRPASNGRELRSIAHLKMLQSLVGKLNRLNDVTEIGRSIINELRSLIDYHNCRVYVAEGQSLVPVAIRGDEPYGEESHEDLVCTFGEGITGRAAETGRSVLVNNALACEFATDVPGTEPIDESMIAVPMRYGSLTSGVIVISKFGLDQFDEDDVRLLEVLAGHASVALENASLYEAQKREADAAKALLDLAGVMSKATSPFSVAQKAVDAAAAMLGIEQVSLWLEDERGGEVYCAAHVGYVGDETAEAVIRERIDEASAEKFMTGRRGPFTITSAATDRYFVAPSGVVSKLLAVVPIDPGGGIKAWITVRQPDGKPLFFTEDVLRFLAGIGHQASVAMQKMRLYRDQKESAEIANTLLEFSRELAGAESIDEVMLGTVELTGKLVGSPKTSVWLQEEIGGDVVAQALWGYTDAERSELLKSRFPADVVAGFLGADEPFVLSAAELQEIEGADVVELPLLMAIAPIHLEGRLGCITAYAPALGNYEFSERKMRLLAGVAHQAKLAITTSLAYESLESTFLSTVESLANALEAKDEYTSNHARTITDMAIEVGHKLGIEGRALKRLELGALFHDIGKIGIPSAILAKPGALSDEEYEIIKSHPELGEKILAPIARLADVRPIVRHCHEHFDGSGYPDQKVGDDIPIESRIILVCDAFDAMTTDRPYRTALSIEEARRRLQWSAGSQFDPEVVSVFLGLLDENDDFSE